MLRGLEGKRVLVTGGAQGIGFAVAQRFAQEGASVFLVDRTDASHLGQAISEVRKVAAKNDAIIDGVKGDVSQETSVDAAFQKAIDALGHPTS
jgi:NAD(P)-dependent dehydrogenase (short-subunit alcohol dehydrogenase family)